MDAFYCSLDLFLNLKERSCLCKSTIHFLYVELLRAATIFIDQLKKHQNKRSYLR